ncbi:acyl carrier protein [Caldimonas brevitalea]|uniref:Carrier domain-containing protein n=1 Tax=Caldimonas brevitalea TaxID=413882 RepID=A0A0G3BR57_9BURK|nr:acyl carrier protein [Caldimonas brevitalea]AKJ29035.1 hypothetical protein AAW51_2344 [Caldimonas brevitalea]
MKFNSIQEIEDWLVKALSEEADIPIEDIEPSMSFASLGIDSVESVGLACQLDAMFEDFTVKPDLFWEVNSVRELATELFRRAQEAAARANVATAA